MPPGPTTSTTRCASRSPTTPTRITRTSAASPSSRRRSTAHTCTPGGASLSRPPPPPPPPSPPRSCGAPAEDVPPKRFVVYCQDHDQVGNRAYGDRLPEHARRLAAFCTLLAPFTPLLFMGEEYGENAPFRFFSDHIDKRIAKATREGRRREFAAFAHFGEVIPDPQDPATFEASKLTRTPAPRLAGLYSAVLRARRRLPRGDAQEIRYDEDARWL